MSFYQALLQRVTAAGVEIIDNARISEGDPLGNFDREYGVIRLFHPRRADTPDEIPDGCTLAQSLVIGFRGRRGSNRGATTRSSTEKT